MSKDHYNDTSSSDMNKFIYDIVLPIEWELYDVQLKVSVTSFYFIQTHTKRSGSFLSFFANWIVTSDEGYADMLSHEHQINE